MVRVGGGWDTLQNYLDKHDPCRCRRGAFLLPHPQTLSLLRAPIHHRSYHVCPVKQEPDGGGSDI